MGLGEEGRVAIIEFPPRELRDASWPIIDENVRVSGGANAQ